jgi:hypothetical protein
VLRITNKRTNKTEKRPRGSNGLAERSLSFEFHANRSINKEMAADLVSCVQDNKQTNKQNSKRTPRFKRARRKKLKFRISCRSEHKQGNGSRFSENPWVKFCQIFVVFLLNTAAIRAFMKRFQRNSGVKLLSASLFEWRGLFLAFLIVCLFVWTQQQMLLKLSKWLNKKKIF